MKPPNSGLQPDAVARATARIELVQKLLGLGLTLVAVVFGLVAILINGSRSIVEIADFVVPTRIAGHDASGAELAQRLAGTINTMIRTGQTTQEHATVLTTPEALQADVTTDDVSLKSLQRALNTFGSHKRVTVRGVVETSREQISALRLYMAGSNDVVIPIGAKALDAGLVRAGESVLASAAPYLLATYQYAVGDTESALSTARSCLRQSPRADDALACNFIGIVHYDRREVSAAKRLYRLALTMDPKLEAAWFNLGIALEREDSLPGALEAYTRASESGRVTGADLGIARVASKLGADDAASKAADRAYAHGASRLEVTMVRGRLMLDEHKYAAAVDEFEFALEMTDADSVRGRAALYLARALVGLRAERDGRSTKAGSETGATP